jgi:archaeal flagellar protein FlaJ
MRLTAFQRFRIRLLLRYKFKREVFTLVIPCIIAIILVVFAVRFGFVQSSAFGSGLQSAGVNATNANNIRQVEIQLAQANGSALTIHPAQGGNPNQAKEDLDFVLVGAPVIALTAYTVDVTLRERRARKYQEDFASFLFELSELVRGGIDPVRSFRTLADENVGTISKFVKTAAKQMEIGYSFEEAMRNLGKLVGNDLVSKYIDLVVQASYSGGSVSGLIQRAAADLNAFIAIDKEKRAGLQQYTLILYTGQVVLIALAAILVIQFLPSLSAISQIGAAGLSGFLGNSDIGSVTVERDMFYLVLVNGFLGGLVIGKLSEGKLKYGLKHSLALVLIALIAWTFFVTPLVSTSQQYNVTLVKYDTTGTAGLPLKDPLIVRITSLQGSPVNNIFVGFSITSPANSVGASVNPTSLSTDVNGTAQTTIAIGDTGGVYTVYVTVGATVVPVPIIAGQSSEV